MTGNKALSASTVQTTGFFGVKKGEGKPVGVRVLPSAHYERVNLLWQEPAELSYLIALICYGSNGSKYPFCDAGTVEVIGQGEDLSPNLRREP
jgi:hypothetical protein